jgi:hypothetical protein
VSFRRLPQTLRRTLTRDQWQEMANHAAIAKAAKLDTYFCDPVYQERKTPVAGAMISGRTTGEAWFITRLGGQALLPGADHRCSACGDRDRPADQVQAIEGRVGYGQMTRLMVN